MAAAVALCWLLVVTLPHVGRHDALLGLTFNSMLDHLLHGRADVDPAVVGQEGFTRNGRVYAYWGILPAILRLPLVALPGWRGLHVTTSYCIVALLGMLATKLWTVRRVLRASPQVPRSLAGAVYVVILLSGAQLCFLRLTVYQEVCFWAALCGALFVAAAVSARQGGLTRRNLLVMAGAAGAALLTRVSVGIGLIAAFGLLSAAELLRRRADWRGQVRRFAWPVLVLAAAGAITALVNQARWGNPLTFADYRLYNYNAMFPDRLARTAEYGLFNLRRVPFGLLYYFLPAWAVGNGRGGLLFEDARDRLIDSVELPPSSFLLTDPLLLALGALALLAWHRRGRGVAIGVPVALGLAVPPLLMLSAISMCFRYRMDFYPLIEFLAFSGLGAVGRAVPAPGARTAWLLAIVSVAGSAVVLWAYLVGGFGPAQELIGGDVVGYYTGLL